MKVLVPIDFTPVTENALQYATRLPTCNEVTLFHVVASDSETQASTAKLEALSAKYSSNFIGKLNNSVKTGNIFDHIGEEALHQKSDIIVMGTHGVKGMQRFIGSYAMKVITNSKTPYIVVQHQPFSEIKNILVPVDLTKESKQVLPFLIVIAKRFNAKLLLLKQNTGKDEFIRNKVENNLAYFKSVLTDNQCTFEVPSADYSFDKKYKSIMKESKKLNIDLIVTAIDPKVDVADYIMGVEEQKIVANEEQIPVLCINTKSFSKFTGSIFGGGA